MTQSYRLQHLFQKYLRNECSEPELVELTHLLNEMEDDELDAPLKALWERSKDKTSGQHIDWDQMLQEVKASEDNLITLGQNKTRHHRRLWLNVAAAAIVLICLSVGLNYYLYHRNDSLKLTYTETRIPVKHTKEIILEDGSRITLNAGSNLRYPERFSGKTREVYLEGEALFDVAHDPDKPFIVHSGQLKTIVLGTTFNISAYPGAEKMQVTVISGKVSVQETVSKKITTLLPNQKAVFNTKTAQFLANDIKSTDAETAWQQGRIGFDDASLAEVAAQFYRQYGVHIKLGNPNLANCRISIVLSNDSVDNLLKTIASLSNAQYKYQGDEVILYGPGCN